MQVSERLLARGEQVVGIDALTPYYDPALKRARLEYLKQHSGFSFHEADLADAKATRDIFEATKPDRIVHLAAHPGVRASINDPIACIRANCDAFVSVLENARRNDVKHLVFASSSSVYGANRTLPYSTHQPVDHPMSLYAASKRASELMAHSYAHVHGLPVTGLRFFTVYGPWGRPDMAVYIFTRAIFENRPIEIFNNGNMRRDFTYIDDIAEGVLRTLDRPAAPDPAWDPEQPDAATSSAPLSNLQHRQQSSGEPARFRVCSGKDHRQAGHSGSSSDAAGRRDRDLRRYFGTSARCRIFVVSLLSRRASLTA